MSLSTDDVRVRLRALVLRKVGVGEVDMGRLKVLRVRHGVTQAEIADLIGVDRSAYTGWERGRKSPTRDHARVLAAVLDELERLSA